MYLTDDEQTGILLETIEDAQQLVGEVDGFKVTEVQANRLFVAFQMILVRAKRHSDWPEKVRERQAKYAADKNAKAEPAPVVVPVASTEASEAF